MRHTLATVLLVVDDADTLAQTRERLEAAGYRDVLSCGDSSRTEELLAAHEPDLLLLGSGRGTGILEQLRANEMWRQLPVIVLVPEHDSDAKRVALAAGATDILVTPPDASELVLRLRNALAFKAYEDRLLKRDPLTGLANRTEFMRRVQAVLAREKAGASSCSLVLLDVDRFKQINDSLGHAGGDALLRLIAERLGALIARHAGGNRRADSDVPTPWLARLESDRFMALLPASPGDDRHDQAMHQLVESLARPFHLARREFHVSASIGVASSPDHGSDVETLNRHAELALIQAKKRGGNAVEYFSAEMQTRATERLDFENHLRYAIRRGELRLFYQPKVDCASLRMVGVEALIRWQHPVHGLIPPQRFIPVAEEAGLIDEIGAWALQAACRQGARWLQSGLPAIQIAVNLSAAQLLQPGLAGELAVILRDTGFPPARLTLELTESMLMTAGEEARRTIDVAQGARRRLVARRLRHRLFTAHLPAAAADRRDQDRPVVRAWSSCAAGERRDRRGDHRAGRRTRPAGGRRRRRDRGRTRVPAQLPPLPIPGLPLQPAGSRRRADRHAAGNAGRDHKRPRKPAARRLTGPSVPVHRRAVLPVS